MLADADRIFTNLYGRGDWGLDGARRRAQVARARPGRDIVRPEPAAEELDMLLNACCTSG